MGWISVEKILDLRAGKSVPDVIDTGLIIVTKENVDSYMAEVKAEVE